MNTLYNADCCLILAKISWSDADPIRATAQAMDFFKACREHDPEWQQYASNPDLVEALGGMSADVFLGWS